MFQANLPKKFWGESILIATYIINKLPIAVLEWKSPFEVFHGHPPSYYTLKTFGCLCYATNTNPHKDKFTERAHKCIFVGCHGSKRI